MWLLMVILTANAADPKADRIVGRLDTYERCDAQAKSLNKPLIGNPYYCVLEDPTHDPR